MIRPLLIVVLLAQQSYAPPPPPKLPEAPPPGAEVSLGRGLFERNVFEAGKLEIHNYLGSRPCGSCHDKPSPLRADSLARNFKEIRSKINAEIVEKGGGEALTPEDPAMEALVQYLVDRYRLYERKLPK